MQSTLQNLLGAITLTLLGACAVEAGDSPGPGDDGRGALGKADLVGSCMTPEGGDLCGGPGLGNCFCDEACTDFGDCCSDAGDVCGVELPEPEGELCGGFLGDTCGDDEFCAYEAGQHCGAADASAHCEPRPEFCIELFAPVCGCDGNTYGNSCKAGGAGTGVLHDGACPDDGEEPGQFCGGIANIACPEGQVCVNDPTDNCDPALGGADCGGVCVTDPDPDPACGDVLCALFCENGFATDEDGCAICQCAEDPLPEPCHIGGCNGELCVGPDGPDASICIALPEAACFSLSTCGNNGPNGACGWDMNEEFLECMASVGEQ
jgi:hypothetical protein